MHAILASLGTDGDVFPFIGLGARLRARGHRVTLAANEPYRALAEAHDLDFRALASAEDTQEFISHPDLWNPLKGPVMLAQWGGRQLGGRARVEFLCW